MDSRVCLMWLYGAAACWIVNCLDVASCEILTSYHVSSLCISSKKGYFAGGYADGASNLMKPTARLARISSNQISQY